MNIAIITARVLTLASASSAIAQCRAPRICVNCYEFDDSVSVLPKISYCNALKDRNCILTWKLYAHSVCSVWNVRECVCAVIVVCDAQFVDVYDDDTRYDEQCTCRQIGT